MTRYADLSREDRAAVSAEIARAECAAQGIPFTVEDPSVLAKVARIAAGASRAAGSCPEPVRGGHEAPGLSSGEDGTEPIRIGSPTVASSPVHQERAS